MGSVTLKSLGDWSRTYNVLNALSGSKFIDPILDEAGRLGVEALASATPKDTGLTAASWYYEVRRGSDATEIVWKNSNLTKDGDPVAILLQYGHGTGTGGYVAGVDYINPAMQDVFASISDTVAAAIRSKLRG